MEVASWSTTEVEPHLRFEYWKDLIIGAMLDANVTQRSGDDFNATVSTRRLRDTAFTSFHSPPYEVDRRSKDISRDNGDAYLLSLQLEGNAEIRQGDHAMVLNPGDLSMVDSGRPFSVRFSRDVRRMIAILPRRTVHRYAPMRWNMNALPIGETAPCVDLLREYILRLADPAFSVDDAVAEVLGENLCALLGVVVSHHFSDLADIHSQGDLQLEALLAYIRRNCSNPGLSPSTAAAHLRVSVRTLHKLMERTERSFGEWLLDERLHRCVGILQDPNQVRRKISDIAWACGFNDLSHFNNMFKSRLDTTPSDLRRTAMQAWPRPI
jgi:AraC family transcriptional activator of tynA and feaB